MQVLRDIFTVVWPNARQLSIDINEEYDTVRKWRTRGRIPESAWPKIIEKAARREHFITAAKLLEINGKVKRRGRPVKAA